jgi:hypothetical protein
MVLGVHFNLWLSVLITVLLLFAIVYDRINFLGNMQNHELRMTH